MRILGKTSASPDVAVTESSRTAAQAEAEYQQALARATAAQERIIARVKETVTDWCRQQAEEKALSILEDVEHYPHPVPALRDFKTETIALQERLNQAAEADFRTPSVWAHNAGVSGVSYSRTPWKERVPRETNALEPAWSLLIQQAGDELDALFEKYGFRQWQGMDFMFSDRLVGEAFIQDETIASTIGEYETAVRDLNHLRAEFKQLEDSEKRRKAKELWDSF